MLDILIIAALSSALTLTGLNVINNRRDRCKAKEIENRLETASKKEIELINREIDAWFHQ